MKSKQALESEYHPKKVRKINEFNFEIENELDNFDTETISVILPDEALMFFLHAVSVLTSKIDSTPAIIMPTNVKPQERIHFLKEKGSSLCVWNESTSSYTFSNVPNSGYSLASIESAKHGKEVKFLRPPKGDIYALTSRDTVEKVDGPVIAKPSNYWNQIVPLNVSTVPASGVSFNDLTNIVNAIYKSLPDSFQDFPVVRRTCMCHRRRFMQTGKERTSDSPVPSRNALQEVENSKSKENCNKINDEKIEPSNVKICAPKLNYWPQSQALNEKAKLNGIDYGDNNKASDSTESVKTFEYVSKEVSQDSDSKVQLEKYKDLIAKNLEKDHTSESDDHLKSLSISNSETSSFQTSDGCEDKTESDQSDESKEEVKGSSKQCDDLEMFWRQYDRTFKSNCAFMANSYSSSYSDSFSPSVRSEINLQPASTLVHRVDISKSSSSLLYSGDSDESSDSNENDQPNEPSEEGRHLNVEVETRAKKLGEDLPRLWNQFNKNLENFKAKTNGVVDSKSLPEKVDGDSCRGSPKENSKQSSEVLEKNTTKANHPKTPPSSSSPKGPSSDTKFNENSKVSKSLAKPTENGSGKNKAGLNNQTPPTSPQTERHLIVYQSIIDKIGKSPRSDRNSPIGEKMEISQPPIACHRVSINRLEKQNSEEPKVRNGVTNGTNGGIKNSKQMTISPLYKEKRQDTPHPVKGLKKPIGSPAIISVSDKGSPTKQDEPTESTSCDNTGRSKVQVGQKSPSQSSKPSGSSIEDDLPDCLKPFAAEIATILSHPFELPTPPSTPKFVKTVPISELNKSSSSSDTDSDETVKETSDSPDEKEKSKENTTDSDKGESKPEEEDLDDDDYDYDDDGDDDDNDEPGNNDSDSPKKSTRESKDSLERDRSKFGATKQNCKDVLKQITKLALEEDDKDLLQLQASPATKEPPEQVVREVSEYMKKTAFKMSERAKSHSIGMQNGNKISPTVKSKNLAKAAVRRIRHGYVYLSPDEKSSYPSSLDPDDLEDSEDSNYSIGKHTAIAMPLSKVENAVRIRYINRSP
nr:hypothetical protein HmN_000519800 [Hymenolepis microstoma]